MNYLLFAGPESDFITVGFPIIRAILLGIVTLACLVMIVTTLLQSSANQNGSSAISGGATDTYFSQNKDNSRDGKLKRTTIWMVSIMAVCVVLYFVTGFWLAL